MSSYTFPTVSQALPILLRNLREQGEETSSRNGRVVEFLNTQITLKNPVRREVLCPGRGANIFAQIAETCWVLSGRYDIEWLSAYLPRAKNFSDDGLTWRSGYGPRLRAYDGQFDQVQYVIDTLTSDPLSRQAVISIWDPRVDGTYDKVKDRACNTQLQFQSRLGQLHLTVTVRSNDVMWGWSGINAFEWSVLQEIVASLLGIQVGPLTFNIGNLHLYEHHWDKAKRIEGPAYELGESIRFNPIHTITSLTEVDRLLERWFIWEEMCRQGEATPEFLYYFEEPLFRKWAAVIAYYWTRGEKWLDHIQGTTLWQAVACTPRSLYPEPVRRSEPAPVAPTPTPVLSERSQAFLEYVSDLHAKKHASYGNSWKKRGEKLSILPNMARKVDRLGVGDEFDSSADTWIDLLVYGIKYGLWLQGESQGPDNVSAALGDLLGDTENVKVTWDTLEDETGKTVQFFDSYVEHVFDITEQQKRDFVTELTTRIAPIARDVWISENTVNDYRGADVD